MELRGKIGRVGRRATDLGLLLTAGLTAGILAGCATQSITQTHEPFPAGRHRAVQIEPCEDRTGVQRERDLKEEATRTFNEKIKAATLFEVRTDAPLVLTCDIERFTEGSALKRWVQPRWGSTVAIVSVMVWERADAKALATFRSQSSVSAGGLYTVGADQYILAVAFEDIVRQLDAWAKGTTPGKAP